MELSDMSDGLYKQMKQDAIAWQYLTVKAGGMARKSDLDRWLMQTFKLSQYAAHTIANAVESERDFVIGRDAVTWIAQRPEPLSLPTGWLEG